MRYSSSKYARSASAMMFSCSTVFRCVFVSPVCKYIIVSFRHHQTPTLKTYPIRVPVWRSFRSRIAGWKILICRRQGNHRQRIAAAFRCQPHVQTRVHAASVCLAIRPTCCRIVIVQCQTYSSIGDDGTNHALRNLARQGWVYPPVLWACLTRTTNDGQLPRKYRLSFPLRQLLSMKQVPRETAVQHPRQL